jgi:hypothetical protein
MERDLLEYMGAGEATPGYVNLRGLKTEMNTHTHTHTHICEHSS